MQILLLAVVTHFDALNLVDEEFLPDQEHASCILIAFLAAPIVHQLLACPSLDGKTVDANTMFEEETIFATTADDDL